MGIHSLEKKSSFPLFWENPVLFDGLFRGLDGGWVFCINGWNGANVVAPKTVFALVAVASDQFGRLFCAQRLGLAHRRCVQVF